MATSFFILAPSRRFLLEIHLCNWLEYRLTFTLDFLSAGFFLSVSFISSIVFLYRIFYIEGTNEMRRFSWLVLLFVISIFLLVFSSNILGIFLGWDGLGLISFCLVVFYPNRSRVESGLITIFINRVGDAFFLIRLYFFYTNLSWKYESFFYFSNITFLLLIFLGSITKSAQVPFSAWLPAAMAAPTPVSSLVHSSTLVTAGVYILIRFNFLFNFITSASFKIFFILTMIRGGLSACLESDFKKIVAISTLSQLGLILFILSLRNWLLSFIHIVIHAFFKRMLFLRTGSLIIQIRGSQDSRFFGRRFPSYGSSIHFLVSSFCLSGIPFFIGFYSKDLIIYNNSFLEGSLLYCIFLAGCLFTVTYSIRLIKIFCVSLQKINPPLLNKETFLSIFSVSFLTFKGWVTGSLYFWYLLSENRYSIISTDIFMRLLVITTGTFFYNTWNPTGTSKTVFFNNGIFKMK